MRLLEFMGAAARLDEASRSDLERLKASLRRLATQLNSMHRPTTSIAALEAAGKWAEHELVQEKVRAEANAVLTTCENTELRDARLARRVHDSLLSTVVTVDCAPNRPGCLRVLKMPESESPCDCGAAGCPGNRFVGMSMVLVHSKTARFRSNIVVDFGGTLTERLLGHHLSWGRPLLLARDADTDAVWISTRGQAFRSDEAFGAYLPRVLARLDLPHLSYTTLRHAAVVAASEWATREELEGMAISIGTSVRKIQAVYDYRCAERSAGRFLTAYRTANRGRASPPEEEDADVAGVAAAGAAAGSGSSEGPPATEPPVRAPAPRAPSATPHLLALRPIQAFSRLLGIGRKSPPEARTEAPTPADMLIADGGAWRSAFDLPSSMMSRGAPEPDNTGGHASAPVPSHRTPHAPTQPTTQLAPMVDEDDEEDDEPPPRRRRRSSDQGGARNRVEVRTTVTSFAEFLAAHKKTHSHGPGRAAAPVKRWLTRAEATLALGSGMSAQRAAYAWAYGFETKSGNLQWLRNKIEEAVRDEREEAGDASE